MVFIEHKKPVEALFWVMLITLLPVIGVVIYSIFGSTFRIKLHYFLRSRNLYQELQDAFSYSFTELEACTSELTETQRENIIFHKTYNNGEIAAYNQAEIITNATQKYEKLFSDLEQARQSLYVVYYAIHGDKTGKRFIKALIKKAKEGVSVRVLYDGVGSMFTSYKLFRKLRQAGGRVRKVKSSFTHFRNHRKIVVIDGRIGYTGGMNIGDKYLGEKKHKSPWRDTQIRIKGDAVYALQYYFYYDWYYAGRKKDVTYEELCSAFPPHGITEENICQVIAGGADTNQEAIKMTYMKLISTAKNRIVMQTPYLVPDESLFNALKIAMASGVEVILMIPMQSPGFFLESTTNYYVSMLLPYGLRVYRYKGYLHAKTITIDREITCIGTANIDVRSIELDDEICILFYGKEMIEKHLAILEQDMKNAEVLDVAAFENRGVFTKAKERFFKLFSPLL